MNPDKPLTKREKWRLHRLEFLRLIRGYMDSPNATPLRHLCYQAPKVEEDKEE
jgi:hypothetical protein